MGVDRGTKELVLGMEYRTVESTERTWALTVGFRNEEEAQRRLMGLSRVSKLPIVKGEVGEYTWGGLEFEGVKDGLMSEIDWRVMAIYDDKGKPLGVSALPIGKDFGKKQRLKVIPVEEVDQKLLYRKLPGWQENGERFLTELDEWWGDGGKFWQEIKVELSRFDQETIFRFGTMETRHINALGFEQKYLLWQLMQDEKGVELVKKMTERFGLYGLRAVQVFEGDGEYLGKLIEQFDRLKGLGIDVERYMRGLPISLFEGDSFVVEFGMMASRKPEKYQQAVDFLLPRWRGMAKEIVDGLEKVETVSEFGEFLAFAQEAGNAWMGFSYGLRQVLDDREIGNLPRLTPEWWERMMNWIEEYPEQEEMLESLALFWAVSELYWGRHVDVESKREWLRKFYEHVVFEVGVYDESVAKEAYADDAEKEREILEGLLEKELKRIEQEKGKDYRPRVLFVGVGNGMRVEGPVVEELKKEGYEFEVLGVDMLADELKEKGVKIHPEFEGRLKTGRLESLAQDLESEDKFDVVVMWGTGNLNMNLLIEQMRYLREIVGLMKSDGSFVYQIIIPEFKIEENEYLKGIVKSWNEGVWEVGFGDRFVNPHYVDGVSFTDKDVGARFFPLWVWLSLWEKVFGLEVSLNWNNLREIVKGKEINRDDVKVWDDQVGGSLVMIGKKTEMLKETTSPLMQVLD